MYQLPPGFVPVLVSNTGSLQPLMSIPPQQVPQPSQATNPPAAVPLESIAQPQASLSVPQDSASRRSSEASQGQQMVIIQQAVEVEPPEEPSPSPQPQGGAGAVSVGEAFGDNNEAVDEKEEDGTQTKDVRASGGTLKFVVMPSSSLYSSTSSLSSTFSCADHHLSSLHVQPRPHLNLDADYYQQSQGIRKSSVPNNEVHLHQEALLRRGSLPASMLLNQEQQARLSTRRSSSGAIVPPQLATLRENRGDSDISLEDLSQVRFSCFFTEVEITCGG